LDVFGACLRLFVLTRILVVFSQRAYSSQGAAREMFKPEAEFNERILKADIQPKRRSGLDLRYYLAINQEKRLPLFFRNGNAQAGNIEGTLLSF